MITENGCKILNAAAGQYTVGNKPMTAVDGESFVVGSNATLAYYYLRTALNVVTESNTLISNGMFVAFGNGNTAARKTDIALESPINSGLTLESYSSITPATISYVVGSTAVVRNTSDSSITINEVGLYIQSTAPSTALIARNVLDEPVTLSPLEAASFTIAIG